MLLSSSFRTDIPHSYEPPAYIDGILRNVPKHGRLRLANLPTPIHRVNNNKNIGGGSSSSILSRLAELNINLYIKRDDATSGTELGGNKLRKLEFLLADAISSPDYDSIVTIGGEQSNHCRATASACRLVGLEPHIILRTARADAIHAGKDDIGITGNVLYDRMVGSTIYTVSPREYAQLGSTKIIDSVCNTIRQKDKHPYSIPVGGSNGIGTWGYIDAVDELIQQIETSNISTLDHVVFATGSGGTATGITVGLSLAYGCHGGVGHPAMQDKVPPRIHAVAVCDHPDYFYRTMSTLNIENSENNKSSHPYYFHPRDRNGKILGTRYTTDRVQKAMSDYVEACSNARAEVERVLTRLSWNLIDGGHLTAILQSSHLNLILATAANHAANSKAKGWSAAIVYDDADNDGYAMTSAGYFDNVRPYWMSQSVSNSFDLDGMFLLTAPNMSGKSTLMRSTAAAALLINSGLCGPVKSGTRIRRFDSIFVRGASADVPTEDKSAFGSEMGDVASLLRSCGSQSLVFVDEIGRGTSPKDGTSLAGAILEEMSGSSGMSGMFATHLHGILNLPYSSAAEARLRKKRMAITENDDGDLKWTYLLEDGICTNSLALLTASKFGLPEKIIKRARELSKYCDTEPTEDDNSLHRSIINYSTNPHNFQHARTILEEVVGNGSIGIPIPPMYMPPPSFEGSSCVYVLQIGDDESRMKYYVGETDSLSRRLSQHRSKGSQEWRQLHAIAIKITEGKSLARNIENRVIKQMAKSGFNLISITDGTS